MTRAAHLAAGENAEEFALRELERRGLRMITRNYRCHVGELDLVMDDHGVTVVVEVRYRKSRAFGSAAETVTASKRNRLARAAAHLLQCNPKLSRRPLRFDVVALQGDSEALGVDWIRDAFQVP